jgi:hypothetical protein
VSEYAVILLIITELLPHGDLMLAKEGEDVV